MAVPVLDVSAFGALQTLLQSHTARSLPDVVAVEELVLPVVSTAVAAALRLHPSIPAFAVRIATSGSPSRDTLVLRLPQTATCLAFRVALFLVYRLYPRRLFAYRAVALLWRRAKSHPTPNYLDSTQFAAKFAEAAGDACDAEVAHPLRRGMLRMSPPDVWRVLCADGLLNDRAMDFAAAVTLAQVERAAPGALHIPSSHFFAACAANPAGAAARRLFAWDAKTSDGNLDLPPLTAIVCNRPGSDHWTLCAVERRDAAVSVAFFDSLKPVDRRRRLPAEVAILRQFLAAHSSAGAKTPWQRVTTGAVQSNDFDCGLFAIANLALIADRVARRPAEPVSWEAVLWTGSSCGLHMRRDLLCLVRQFEPVREEHADDARGVKRLRAAPRAD